MEFLANLKGFLTFLLGYSLCMSTLAAVGAFFRYQYLKRKEAAVKPQNTEPQDGSGYYRFLDGNGVWQIGRMDENDR